MVSSRCFSRVPPFLPRDKLIQFISANRGVSPRLFPSRDIFIQLISTYPFLRGENFKCTQAYLRCTRGSFNRNEPHMPLSKRNSNRVIPELRKKEECTCRLFVRQPHKNSLSIWRTSRIAGNRSGVPASTRNAEYKMQ